MTTSREEALAATSRFRRSIGGHAFGTALTGLLPHGGWQGLADQHKRVGFFNFPTGGATSDPAVMADYISSRFFHHLVEDKPYLFDDDLINLIAGFENGSENGATNGLVFDPGDQPSSIPAVFTFVGQFIDHDLTLNGVNLLESQMAEVQTQATPLIDLDSVYGPRIDDADPTMSRKIPRDGDKLAVKPIEGSDDGIDLMRSDPDINPDTGALELKALIGDKRNDENQIILQIHLLLIRLHNRFVDHGLSFDEAKVQTILHWQSVVATEYLPLVTREPERQAVFDALSEGRAGDLVHQPAKDPDGLVRLMMPHEFAIGFRFGHSQLRDKYRLRQGGGDIKLFDRSNEPTSGLYDLRGSKALDPSHVIEWPYFLANNQSNLIDARVNQVVFNLPQSTIPDHDVNQLNLPNRNLRRSKNLGLCAGEDLLERYQDTAKDKYGLPALEPLPMDLVDPGGTGKFEREGHLRTPLWYYLLREAERDGGGKGQLGRLGSLLVAEVILAGIYYAPTSFLKAPDTLNQIPTITGKPGEVTLRDTIAFVGLD